MPIPVAAVASQGVASATKMLKNPMFWVVLIASVLLLFFRGKIKEYMAKSDAMSAVEQKDDNIVHAKTGRQVMTINLKNVADGIYDAFYDSKFSEDEDKAIALIRSVPTNYVQQVAYLYAQKGKDLYSDFRKFLTKSQYAKVSSKLE